MVFTCYVTTHIHFPSTTMKMELLKDGIPFYKWTAGVSWHFKSEYHTSSLIARQNYTGKYECKGTVGASSRYSAPFNLSVGSKFDHVEPLLYQHIFSTNKGEHQGRQY